MNNVKTYNQLREDVKNSNKILISLFMLSVFGITASLSGMVFETITAYLPGQTSVFMLLTSIGVLIVSLVIYRNTKHLTESLKSVYS